MVIEPSHKELSFTDNDCPLIIADPPTFRSCPISILPLTFKSCPIPTPPATSNAPVFVENDVVLVILMVFVVEFPLDVTNCNVSTDDIITAFVELEIVIPLPDEILFKKSEAKVDVVITREPFEYAVNEYKFPPIPTPPLTTNAPVTVDVLKTELKTDNIPLVPTIIPPLDCQFEIPSNDHDANVPVVGPT